MNEKESKYDQPGTSKSDQSTAVQVASKEQQKITERNLSYDISDEKLLTAAAQLVDVYNKRSKVPATITVQKKQISEPRNRNLNLNKQQIRPPFTVPNFVVTKITEKTRTPEKSIIVRPSKSSHGVNIVKSVQKQEEIEQTKRMIDMQRQKSLHIFNANEDRKPSRILFDAKDFRVKSFNVSNQIAGNTNFPERIKPTTIKPRVFGAVEPNKSNQNEPVILNFRTKMHDPTSKPRQFTDTAKTINGRNNVNTYRMLEISPLSKNSMDRSISKTVDRYYSNKLHSSSIAKSVRPVSMPVTKVYSRFTSNSSRSLYQSRILRQRARAPIVKKFPSMPDLSKVEKVQTNFLGQKTIEEASTSKIFTTLTRSKSSFICGTKSSANLFDHTIKSNEEYSKLYNLCSDVVSKLCFKGQTIRRKRGRPKKKVYNSLTKNLLASPEFSMKADILKLNEMYYASKRFDCHTIFNTNPRRSKRFALLSIEPVLPDIEPILNRTRDRSPPVSSFHINRAPLKTYSRANLIQPRVNTLENKKNEMTIYTSRPQIQLLNIEPLSSTSQINLEDSIKGEVTQSTEYIIDTGFNNDDLDESDAVYIEYLEDNDEIESPAYEPHVSVVEPDVKTSSIITEEADTTVENCSQWDQFRRKKSLDLMHIISATGSLNAKRNQNVEIKYLKTSESDAHSTTDSITDLFTVYEVEEKQQFMPATSSPQKKPDMNISPVRKSTRKRKIPSEFPNFAKKIRG